MPDDDLVVRLRAATKYIHPQDERFSLLREAADALERLSDKGDYGPDTWPRPCSVCGEMLDPDPFEDEPGTHEDTRCQEHIGWCDWGGCNRPAFTTRDCPEDGPVPGTPLSVCIKHSEMWEALNERASLLDEIERLRTALEEIADGCRCRHSDPWAVGQCDCQTRIARAALEEQNDVS